MGKGGFDFMNVFMRIYIYMRARVNSVEVINENDK